MCGFVGTIGGSLDGPGNAIGQIGHRGPDSTSVHIDSEFGAAVAFARLAVLDLSTAASQPMLNDDGSIVMVFNGEIYNFRELRRELETDGFHFRTHSDSEVLLRGYEAWGESVVDHLRGMFAFAIWDRRTQTLVAARDHLGIKPLFFSEKNGVFQFASEIKGILALGHQPKLDLESVGSFFRYLYVPRPRTIFEGVRELEPGHMLVLRGGAVSIRRYWTVPAATEHCLLSEAESVEQLRGLLNETIRMQMDSDVPLGAFLSGGVDSSTIVALMARNSSRPIKTFCMTFGPSEGLYDEREYAQIVARHFSTDHTEIPVRPNVVEMLPEVVRHFDEPFGNPTALLSFALSEQTRKYVTVALAGDGGDELFLGYPRYQGVRLAEKFRKVPAVLRHFLAQYVAPQLRDSTRGRHVFRRAREFLGEGERSLVDMYTNWIGYFSTAEIGELLTPGFSPKSSPDDFMLQHLARFESSNFVDTVNRADLETFLPSNLLHYSDRMSMAHSLEVRVPFCDHRLAEFAMSLPVSRKLGFRESKKVLRAAVADILPHEILHRPKLGFNPPMGIWLNRELQPLLDEKLDPVRLRKQGIFNPEPIERYRKAHATGQRDYSLHIWAILVFQTWLELYNPVI